MYDLGNCSSFRLYPNAIAPGKQTIACGYEILLTPCRVRRLLCFLPLCPVLHHVIVELFLRLFLLLARLSSFWFRMGVGMEEPESKGGCSVDPHVGDFRDCLYEFCHLIDDIGVLLSIHYKVGAIQ